MGYSKAVRAIILVKNYLDLMLNSDVNLEFDTDNVADLSYRIRTGIKAAQYQSPESQYRKYSSLGTKFIIRTRNNKVVAELRDPTPLPIKQALSKLVLADVNDALEAIGAIIEHKPTEVFFPNYDDDLLLPKLYNYAKENEFKIIKHEVGLTVTKNNVDESVTWKP